MKKFLIPVFACMMSAMPVFSAAISDYYCANSVGTVCFGVNDLREMAELSGTGNTKADDAVKLITTNLNERFGFDLDKDLEHIGAFFTPSPTGSFDCIGFITGNFSSEKKIQAVTSSIQSLASEAKFEKVKMGEKSISTMSMQGFKLAFINDNIALIGKDDAISRVISGNITFKKAPETVATLIGKSDTFIQTNGAVLGILGTIPQIPSQFSSLANGCNSVSAFYKDSRINIDLVFNDKEGADKICEMAESTIKNLLDMSKKSHETAKNKLNEVSLKDFFGEAKNLFTAAKSMDDLEEIKISKNGTNVYFSAPVSKTQIAIGAIGLGAAMAIPNFQKARTDAREKVCFSNQRVILGAVEMYNMDNEKNMMKDLDMQTLVKERYLKSEPAKPEDDCSYYSDGDLSTDGEIKCKRHGGFRGH